jgi:hypothetical protein
LQLDDRAEHAPFEPLPGNRIPGFRERVLSGNPKLVSPDEQRRRDALV